MLRLKVKNALPKITTYVVEIEEWCFQCLLFILSHRTF